VITVALLALACVVCLLVHPDCTPVTRRAFTRLAIWASAGLSFVVGCGSDGVPVDDTQGLLWKWTRLGRVWRRMSEFRNRNAIPDVWDAWAALQTEMRRALKALPAWHELRVAFEQRYDFINTVFINVPCYAPLMAIKAVPPAQVLDNRVWQLERLAKEGALTRQALRKAAKVLAVQIERLARPAGGDDPTPTPESVLAGKRLAELTVNQLGVLAGPPKENEGFPPPTCYGVPLRDRPT
jgi:hypothetical protein